ncbi:hypothetical protein GGQ20_002688 [Salinibacter ruber]|nr:hypothetical protein [Salinibacter ruber]
MDRLQVKLGATTMLISGVWSRAHMLSTYSTARSQRKYSSVRQSFRAGSGDNGEVISTDLAWRRDTRNGPSVQPPRPYIPRSGRPVTGGPLRKSVRSSHVPRTAARFDPGLTPEKQEPRPGTLFGGRAAAHCLQAAIHRSCEPRARSVAAFPAQNGFCIHLVAPLQGSFGRHFAVLPTVSRLSVCSRNRFLRALGAFVNT